MHALIVAAVNPDNTPHGYNWTFAFPMILFAVIALVLWALFGRPHQRVPAGRLPVGLSSRVSNGGSARAAAVAGGVSLAPGGGASESAHEPSGALLTDTADLPEATDGDSTSTAGSGASE